MVDDWAWGGLTYWGADRETDRETADRQPDEQKMLERNKNA